MELTMKSFLITIILFANVISISGQRKWKRENIESPVGLFLLHSTQTINLPTTTTLNKGEFEFEISHRFLPTIKGGSKDLFGLDGPVNMRIALGYAVDGNTLITLGRSNYQDNVDLWIKRKIFDFNNSFLPMQIGVRVGAAWNTEVLNRTASDSRNFQYSGQIILNGLWNKTIAFGLVPTYIYNSHIECVETQYTFTLGNYLQYYFSKISSIIFEWTPTITGWRQNYNTVALGLEIETGGHFFKILITNNSLLNATQYSAGADKSVRNGDWRIGFNITRLLTF